VDPAVVPQRIEVSGGSEVAITWEGGTTTTHAASQLRAACQCAECREPSGQERTEAVLAGPDPVTITGATIVGNYAINFVFGPDGHGTGIFPFPALHALADRGSPEST
jgi:DUF971 family protein